MFLGDKNINAGGYDTLNYSSHDYKLSADKLKILEDAYNTYSSISFDAKFWNTNSTLPKGVVAEQFWDIVPLGKHGVHYYFTYKAKKK